MRREDNGRQPAPLQHRPLHVSIQLMMKSIQNLLSVTTHRLFVVPNHLLTAGLSLWHAGSMVSISADLFNLIHSGMILSWCSASSTLRAGPSISSPPGQNGMYVDMLGLKSRSTSYDEYNKNPNDLQCFRKKCVFSHLTATPPSPTSL